MRTLGEIIDAAKEGQPTTREELGRTIVSESVVWEKVVRERKITAN